MKTSLTYRLLTGGNGPLLFVTRLVLLPLYLVYLLVVSARNALYDTGLLQPTKVDKPVVSVGNLTVGGTGKTPLVIALARRAVAAGKRVGVVARGYGAVADDEGRTDEVVLIADRVPEAELFIAPDKLLGARQAAEAGVDVILVDDGMQHRRLHRDLEVAVVDARSPYGNGYVLPLGPLREPAAGLGRADVIVLTHHEDMEEDWLDTVEANVHAFRRDIPIVLGRHEPVGVRPAAGGELQPPESLAGKEVFLFCGIASPDGFRQTVEALGAQVTGVAAFQDHHDFRAECLAKVRSQARSAQLLCTEKDAVKVRRIPGTGDVLCLVIDMTLSGDLPPLPGIDGPDSP